MNQEKHTHRMFEFEGSLVTESTSPELRPFRAVVIAPINASKEIAEAVVRKARTIEGSLTSTRPSRYITANQIFKDSHRESYGEFFFYQDFSFEEVILAEGDN